MERSSDTRPLRLVAGELSYATVFTAAVVAPLLSLLAASLPIILLYW